MQAAALTDADRAATMSAIATFFDSRTRAISPISTERAVKMVRKSLHGIVVSDDELTNLIAEHAINNGIAISFDGKAG